MPDFTIDISQEFFQLTETIKRARAALLFHSGPTDFVYIHRRYEGFEHCFDGICACQPVAISQTDYRPSMYFAHQVLYPTVH
jgi:hypothetical protein